MQDSLAKKKIMYLAGEDFYLFCYSIFIILDALKCKDGKFFRDYRKLSYLIEFMKDNRLNFIIENNKDKPLNAIDHEYLFDSYSKALTRRNELLKLIFTLEKKELIVLKKGSSLESIDISLNEGSIPDSFLDRKVFSEEYKNIRGFCKNIKSLSILKLETMLERLYKQNGVVIWVH